MGINITIGTQRDRLTFHLVKALSKEDLEVASKCLELGANANGFDQPRQPLPLLFAKSGDAARLLIDNGADVNARTEHTETDRPGTTKQKTNDYPLHRAVKNKHPDVVAALLEAGADPNVKNSRHDRPLHAAGRAGDTQTCQMLLDHGADPNVQCSKTYEGWRPIHCAGIPDMIRALVRGGADIDGRDSLGKTALHRSLGSLDCTRTLVELGADIEAQDNEGLTPGRLAFGEVQSEAMTYLKSVASQRQMQRDTAPMEIQDPDARPLWDDQDKEPVQVQSSVRRF